MFRASGLGLRVKGSFVSRDVIDTNVASRFGACKSHTSMSYKILTEYTYSMLWS